jgi:predicted ATPase
MKIYFSGTHGSGKTTLARYVSNKYTLPLITEVARMILSEKELQVDNLRTDMDLVDSYQNDIFYRQMSEEAKYKDFVSDRSAIDSLAYSAQHTRILPRLMAAPELKTYIASLKARDSILYFVRPSKATLKADGVREALDWEGAVAIDAQIKLLLEMFEIPYIQINMSNMQERIRLVDTVLSKP